MKNYPKTKKLFELISIDLNNLQFLPKINLMIFTDKELLIINNGLVEHLYRNLTDLPRFLPENSNRGEILESFGMLEYLVNNILEINILGLNDNTINKFSQILNEVALHQKIKLLNTWDLLNKEMKNIFVNLKEVRNEIAHKWHIHNIVFKHKYSLKDDFKIFQADFRSLVEFLIMRQRELIENTNLEILIAKIESFRKNLVLN